MNCYKCNIKMEVPYGSFFICPNCDHRELVRKKRPQTASQRKQNKMFYRILYGFLLTLCWIGAIMLGWGIGNLSYLKSQGNGMEFFSIALAMMLPYGIVREDLKRKI